MVAGVGQFQNRVFHDLALHGQEPGLHVGPARVRRDVRDVRVDRVEVRRTVEAGRETEFAVVMKPAACSPAGLVDRDLIHLRPVDAEFVGAAQPVEVYVTDAVAAAHDRLGIDGVGERRDAAPNPCSRDSPACGRRVPPLFAVRIELVAGSKLRQHVVPFPARRSVFPAHAEVERELGADAEIVLHIPEDTAAAGSCRPGNWRAGPGWAVPNMKSARL